MTMWYHGERDRRLDAGVQRDPEIMRAPQYICLASATSIMTVGAMEHDLRIWLLGTAAMFTGAIITEALPATPQARVAETPADDPRKDTE